MSIPNEIDFALIKMGDGATPTEAFTILCGLNNVTINRTASSQDKFTKDCAFPGRVPVRTQRIQGRQLDISGTGLTNADDIARFDAALGNLKNYKVELYKRDGTDAGDLIGTYAYSSKMTAANLSINDEGDSTAEVTLPSHGTWTYTAAS
jgi:hypothetical protein